MGGGADYYAAPFGIKVGNGVLTTGVSQLRDPFLDIAYRNAETNVGEADSKLAGLEDIAQVLDEVGMFDPDFFMYCEESELSWRIRKAGYYNVNVPQARIVHLEGKSSSIREQRKLLELDGRKKYYIKTRGMCYFAIANALLLLGFNVRIILYHLLGRSQEKHDYQELKRIVKKAYNL